MKKWKVCLLALLSALALTNGAMAEKVKAKPKTWWRQKLIDADAELLGRDAGKNNVSVTIDEETEEQAKLRAQKEAAEEQRRKNEREKREQIKFKEQTKKEADREAAKEELQKKKEEKQKAAEDRKTAQDAQREEAQKKKDEKTAEKEKGKEELQKKKDEKQKTKDEKEKSKEEQRKAREEQKKAAQEQANASASDAVGDSTSDTPTAAGADASAGADTPVASGASTTAGADASATSGTSTTAGADASAASDTSKSLDGFADGEVNGRYAGGYMDERPSDYISGKTGTYIEGGYPKVEDGKLVGAPSYMEGGYPKVEDGRISGATGADAPTASVSSGGLKGGANVPSSSVAPSTSVPGAGASAVTPTASAGVPAASSVANATSSVGGADVSKVKEVASSEGGSSFVDDVKSGASAAFGTAKEVQQDAYAVTSTAKGIERTVGVDTGVIGDANDYTRTAGKTLSSAAKVEKGVSDTLNASTLSRAKGAASNTLNSAGRIEQAVTGDRAVTGTAKTGLDAAANTGKVITSGGKILDSATSGDGVTVGDVDNALKATRQATTAAGRIEKDITGSKTVSKEVNDGVRTATSIERAIK